MASTKVLLSVSIVCQFKKNKVREYTDSDSDCDEDQEDRGLILRQVTSGWMQNILLSSFDFC